MTPIQRNRRGVYTVRVFDPDDEPQNLANCSLVTYFKTEKYHTDAQAAFTKSIGSGYTVLIEASGVLQLVIDAADTNNLNWTGAPDKIPLYFSTVLTDSASNTWPVHGVDGILPVIQG